MKDQNDWRDVFSQYKRNINPNFLYTVGGFVNAVSYLKIHGEEVDLSDMRQVIDKANLLSIKDERSIRNKKRFKLKDNYENRTKKT